jgi:hypothetical protein
MAATEEDKRKIQISKIEAAKRQLDCAIDLWFRGKDEVSIHTLLVASYRVIYDINKKHGTLHEAVYDTPVIKEEYKKEWVKMIAEPSNFFKHADRDPEGQIEFYPVINTMFMLHAVTGLASLKEPPSVLLRILSIWLFVHEPRFLSPVGLEFFKRGIPDTEVAHLRPLSKQEFLETMLKVAADHEAGRI